MRPHPTTVRPIASGPYQKADLVRWASVRARAATSSPPIHATASYPASMVNRTHRRLLTLRACTPRIPPVSAPSVTSPPPLAVIGNVVPVAFDPQHLVRLLYVKGT